MTRARFPYAVLALILLSGCILQSEAPMMADGSATLLLGQGDVALDLFQPDPAHPGQWLPADAPHVTIRAEAGHYVVPDPTEPANPAKAVDLWLLPLDEGHAAVQVTDANGLLYGLAHWDGKTLDLAMLDCKALENKPAAEPWITFDGDDCHPNPKLSDARALFSALVPLMPAPSLRVVLAP